MKLYGCISLLLWLFFFLSEQRREVGAEVPPENREKGWDPDAGYVSTKEEIIASRRKHVETLKDKITLTKQRIELHERGVKVLPEEQVDDLRRRLNQFNVKLEQMDVELSDFDIQRLMAREDAFAETARLRREKMGRERVSRNSEL